MIQILPFPRLNFRETGCGTIKYSKKRDYPFHNKRGFKHGESTPQVLQESCNSNDLVVFLRWISHVAWNLDSSAYSSINLRLPNLIISPGFKHQGYSNGFLLTTCRNDTGSTLFILSYLKQGLYDISFIYSA